MTPSLFGLAVALIDSDSDEEEEIDEATWMLLTRDKNFLALDDIREAASDDTDTTGRRILWTDDFTNLFQILQ